MHLTFVNFFKRTVPGHIFRGKRRLVREIKQCHIEQKLRDYELQERNMALLRKPYLTLAQSSGHAKELGKTEAKIKFWQENPIKPPFKPNVKIEHRLNHLQHNVAWE